MNTTGFQKVIIAAFLGIIFTFYLWTALSSGNSFGFGRQLTGHYNLLSDAFLAGRLSLLVEPKRELLVLPDPYDPSLNDGLRLHDASLYKGKYYLYFGPTPALTLFIPFHLVSNHQLDQNLAVALFSFGGVVWAVLLLHLLTQTYISHTPFWMRFLAISCLSLSNVAPFILRRPLVYEVAISSGYFFLFGSLYWLCSGALKQGRARLWRLSLGSLFLGLAVGSRPHYVIAGIFLPLMWWRFSRERYDYRVGEARRESLCLLTPFLICIGLLGLYNYLRFDSWTEFGVSYQLAGNHIKKWRRFDPERIPIDLFFYFLAPATINLEFPFFHLAPEFPWQPPKGYYGPELVGGILTNIPFLNILFLFPLYFHRSLKESRSLLSWILACFIVLALALAFLISALSATMRYVVDFASLLLLPAILLWFYFDERLKDRTAARSLLRSLSTGCIIYGCIFNVAISITGYADLLKARNLQTYQSIEKAFVPVQRMIAHSLYRAADFGPLALKIRFPLGMPRTSEPLVVTGRSGAGDFAFVKYLGNNFISFGYDHWGRGGPMSAPIEVLPDEIYQLEIHMGSLYPASAFLFSLLFPDANYNTIQRLFIIRLNGTEVLRDRSDFYQSSPSEVTIGENRIRGGVCSEHFSGQIIAFRRIPSPIIYTGVPLAPPR